MKSFLTGAFRLTLLGAAALSVPGLAADNPACKTGVEADATLLSNMAIADASAGKGCNQAVLHYEGNGTRYFEALGLLDHKLNDSSGIFAGAFFDHKDEKPRNVGVAGYHHKLPFESDILTWIDSRGRPRAEIGGEPGLGKDKKLSVRWSINTDREYGALAQYKIRGNLAVTGGYDSRFGPGVGLRWTR